MTSGIRWHFERPVWVPPGDPMENWAPLGSTLISVESPPEWVPPPIPRPEAVW